uniref:Sen15 domain-containing protein n=1 Tax=Steinernema glaseri TaxID=37863 RepID=A0A1I7XZ30_9BILA
MSLKSWESNLGWRLIVPSQQPHWPSQSNKEGQIAERDRFTSALPIRLASFTGPASVDAIHFHPKNHTLYVVEVGYKARS